MRTLTALCGALLAACAASAAPAPASLSADTVELRLLETSDVHGSFFPFDFITGQPRAGSLARVAAYADSLRRQYGDRLILLDNGDLLQGQPSCYYYNYVDTLAENIGATVLNLMRYDAANFGNHDIETGHAVFDKWRGETRCPVLGANITRTATGRPYAPPYTILERGGARVAVIGMVTPAIPSWLRGELWAGMAFDDLCASARRWVRWVREREHADLVVGLLHSGRDGGIRTAAYEENAALRVAQSVAGFDIIFYGHDHAAHKDVVRCEGRDVVCLDPAAGARLVADVTVRVRPGGGGQAPTVVSAGLADLASAPVSQAFMDSLAPQVAAVRAFASRRIGQLTAPCSTRDAYFGSAAFTDLIHTMQLRLTGADISLSAPLAFDATLAAGPLTVADMFALYKYENQLCVMRMTGDEVRRHLEMSYALWAQNPADAGGHLLRIAPQGGGTAARWGFTAPSFNFDSAAGIDYEVDVTRPAGDRVRILRLSDGRAFSPGAWYRVAMNSYRAAGGGELLTRGAGIAHDALPSRQEWQSPRDLRHYLMQEIERQGTITPAPLGNWRFVPDSVAAPAARHDRELLFGR